MDKRIYVASALVGALLGHLIFTKTGQRQLLRLAEIIEAAADEVARARPLWLKIRVAIEEYAQRHQPASPAVSREEWWSRAR